MNLVIKEVIVLVKVYVKPVVFVQLDITVHRDKVLLGLLLFCVLQDFTVLLVVSNQPLVSQDTFRMHLVKVFANHVQKDIIAMVAQAQVPLCRTLVSLEGIAHQKLVTLMNTFVLLAPIAVLCCWLIFLSVLCVHPDITVILRD